MNLSEFFTLNSNFRVSRKVNPCKLHISYCRVDRKYFFSKPIETAGNSFKACDNNVSTSLSSFELLLPRRDLSKFLSF